MHRGPGLLQRAASSARRGLFVLRRRDWVVVFVAVVFGTLLAFGLLVAQVDAYRAHEQSAEQARAQADQAIDTRRAQTRRIDALSRELARTRAHVAAQARTIGRQEQAIRDLAAQVDHLGGDPVTSHVTADRTASRTARPTTSSRTSNNGAAAPSPTEPRPTTTRPTSTPQPAPATTPSPTPTRDGGPLGVCALLPLC